MEIKTFSKKQGEILKFVYSDEGVLICDGAVRSGKTITMAFAFVLWAMENFDRTNFAICGKTVSNTERNILRPFMQIDGMPFTMNYKISTRMLTVKCGTRENYFYMFGGKDESSQALIQGLTIAGVLFDEVALMPKSFVDQAIARTLSYRNAKLWFNCNPASPNHWFYQEWIKDDSKPKKHLHFLMQDNPILGEEEIARAESLFAGVFYQRFILGEWVLAEGLVYPMFEPAKHIADEIPKDGAYYVSMDYGTINPTAMGLWKLTGNSAMLVKEFYHDSRKTNIQKTDEEYYADLETLVGDIPVERVIIDPSAASFKETIRRHGKFRVKDADNAVLDGIRFTASLLNESKIKIHSSCVNIKAEFGEYRWDDGKAQDAVIKEHDHAMDMMRYFCYTMRKRLVKREEYIPLFM